MFKKVAIILIPILFILSCDGLLWDGSAEKGDLTISVNNPFYQSSSFQPSRALDIQGKYLYIELAWINDQNLYDLDANKKNVGNGLWNSTPWGGHGIVTVDLGDWTSQIDSVFKNVPRNKNLKARVLLDIDQITVQSHLRNNTAALCQTSDNGSIWFSLDLNQVDTSALNIPIRPTIDPQSLGILVDAQTSFGVKENYIGSSTTTTEPVPGSSKFTQVRINTRASNELNRIKDTALFLLMDVQLSPEKSLPGYIELNDKNGSPVGRTTSIGIGETVNYPYKKALIVYPEIDENYQNSDYFISSTLFPGNPLTADYYDLQNEKYEIICELLYDSSMTANFSGLTSERILNVYWSMADLGINDSLEFRIIYLETPGNIVESDIETVSQVDALSDDLELRWTNYIGSPDGSLYYSEKFPLQAANEFSWIIILMREPGVAPIIYGRFKISPPV